MSASREKMKRKEQPAVSTEAAEGKKGMNKTLKTVLIIACVLVIIAAVVFFSVINTGYLENHMTAATIDSHKLTPVEVNYFYRNAYSTMVNQYGDYITMFFDPQQPLDEQVCDEETGRTWADVLIEQGLTSAAQTYAMYDAAVDAGFTLNDEQQESIDSQLTMMTTYAAMNGFYSANEFIAAQFGKGCNAENLRQNLYVTTLASAYAQSKADSLTYSADEIQAEYDANPNDYDTVTYRMFTFGSSLYEDEVSEDEMAAFLEKKAAEMAEASQNNEQTFLDLCKENAGEDVKENYEDEAYSLRSNYSYSSCLEAYADWVFDAARQEGDVSYFTADGAAYVIYFLSRNTNDYPLPNVRHILISVSDWEDEEAASAAEQQAQDVLDEFLAGDQTADSFAALAAQYSTDGNAETGGLYENVTPGRMVMEFNDWCFDETRQPGDTGIVKTTYGYHVMFFDSFGANYRQQLVETTLKNEAYSIWEDSLIGDASYEIVEAGIKKVTK